MKITYPAHANVLVEGNGINFACDPWLEGGFVNTCTVWMYPPRRISFKDVPPLDFIYISHEHADHSNPDTLVKMPKDLRIYIMKFRNNVLANKLKDFGFENVVTLDQGETHHINHNTQITILCSEDNWIDSSAVIKHDGFTLYHGNDNFLSAETLAKIAQRFPIDMAFLPYAGFSGYPATYEFPDDLKKEFAERKKDKTMDIFFNAVTALNPKIAVPAAGDLALIGDDVAWMNWFDRCTPDEVVERAQNRGLGNIILPMRPGDAYIPEQGTFVKHPRRDEWGFNTEDVLRFGRQPYVLDAIKKYLSWEQDVQPSDLQREIIEYFRAGLEKYRSSAEEVTTDEVGRYIFTLRATGRFPAEVTVDFKTVTVREGFDPDYTKKMIIDGAILNRVMRRDMLWSDAYASSRMTLDRRPPTYYNLAFWRWLYNLDEMDFYNLGKLRFESMCICSPPGVQ